MELNRPLADLVPSCDTPVLAKHTGQTWQITWSCRLASTGLAWVFPVLGLTSTNGVNIDTVHPTTGAPLSVSLTAVALSAEQ